MLFYALFYRCLCRGDSGNRNIVLIVAIVVVEAMEVRVDDRRCQCGCKRGDLTVFCCRGDSMCVRKVKWRQVALYA